MTIMANGNPADHSQFDGQSIHIPDVPEEIVSRFLDAVRHDAPEAFHDIADLPLREGFDALVYSFAKVNHHRIKLSVDSDSPI